jgi:hypothetical protein
MAASTMATALVGLSVTVTSILRTRKKALRICPPDHKLFERHVKPRLDAAMEDTPVVVIVGPRQCGKSTLAALVAGGARRPPGYARGRRAAGGRERRPDRVIVYEVAGGSERVATDASGPNEALRPRGGSKHQFALVHLAIAGGQ